LDFDVFSELSLSEQCLTLHHVATNYDFYTWTELIGTVGDTVDIMVLLQGCDELGICPYDEETCNIE